MTDGRDSTHASVPPPSWGAPAPPPENPELPLGVRRGEQRPRWKPWTAWVAFVGGFVLATMGFLVLSVIGAAFGADVDDPPPSVTILATMFQNLALIGAALFFARMVARPRPWQFGLRGVRWKPAIGWTLVAWLGFIVFSAIWAAALDLGDEEDTLPDDLGIDESTVALIAVAFLVTVVAPVGEELFFRGFFFRALANWRGVWPAAIISGAVFGAIHAGGSPAGFLVPLAVLGVVLCLLYWKTQSLYPPIVLHCLNNCLALGVTQDWTWQIPLLMVGALSVIALFALATRRAFGPAPARPLPV